MRATMTGWNVDPGTWEVAQGIDTNDDDEADRDVATQETAFGRTQTVGLAFAPRATTVLTFRLKTPGTPYWSRPDLGLDPDDVKIDGHELRVTVHGLGSVPSPVTEMVFRDASGAIRARTDVPALAAPIDLRPKTGTVTLRLPEGADLRGGSVEIDPDHRLEEITRVNNAVKL